MPSWVSALPGLAFEAKRGGIVVKVLGDPLKELMTLRRMIDLIFAV